MKLEVVVKCQSKKENVEKISDNKFKISVKEPALENRANLAVIELLSQYFKVPKSSITLIQGQKRKIKIFEIS